MYRSLHGNFEVYREGAWRIGRAPDCHASHAGVPGSSPADHTGVFLYPLDLISVVTTGTEVVTVIAVETLYLILAGIS